MAGVATPRNTWRIRYYETRAIAERILFDIQTAKCARPGGPFSDFWLASLFAVLNYFFATLESRLATLEAQPHALLLDGGDATLPESLRDLYLVTADILECTREEQLHKVRVLRRCVARFEVLHQALVGFAKRFRDTQQKLREEMAAQELGQGRQSMGT